MKKRIYVKASSNITSTVNYTGPDKIGGPLAVADVLRAISTMANHINSRLKSYGYDPVKFSVSKIVYEADTSDEDYEAQYSCVLTDNRGNSIQGWAELDRSDDGSWVPHGEMYDDSDAFDEFFYEYADSANLNLD